LGWRWGEGDKLIRRAANETCESEEQGEMSAHGTSFVESCGKG